ncbi:nuclear transport factor 2 family protein [uncultured Maricaulis sp.]|uniref:nuclear transport factor 2 family protein n=1 Tax=uncultured Maricaulis sp. TaxID=174710 RepID=UPI0030DB3073|tara:strand:+ start:112951 stop:113433 length:483 start_codon:yes stop_codon:yes gene_type:complete
MIKLTFAAMAALGLTSAVMADADSDRAVAEAYLTAYENQDYDTMRALYATDANFVDPTSFHLPQMPPIDWQGPDTIIDGIASWGISGLEYHLDRSYTASGAVVFDGNADVIYATPSGPRIFTYPIVTIITVSNGLVVEHRDYTDYANSREITPEATANDN